VESICEKARDINSRLKLKSIIFFMSNYF